MGVGKRSPGVPQNAAIASSRACSGPSAEGRVPTHRLQWRRCPGAPSTERAAATAPSARTCPCCPPGWCRHRRRRCRRSLRTTSYQPFGEEEGGGGGEGGGEEEGEGVRSREHGEHGRSRHPFPATCTLYSPPATQPPTHSVTSPAAAAVCVRTLRAENNAGVAEKGRERGGNGAGGGGGEPVLRWGQRSRSGRGHPPKRRQKHSRGALGPQ